MKRNPPAYSRNSAVVGMFSMNQLHYSNPWVIMAWSFFFPGFGQIMLGQYILGWILFLWELFINVHAGFNTAIVLSLTGHFKEAVNVLSAGGTYWILLYGAVFCFSLFTSYQLAVEANLLTFAAIEENVPVGIFAINSLHFNFVSKRRPWIGACWSLLMPGLGQVYNGRIPSSIFILAWWVVIINFSHFLPALFYTYTGHFVKAVSVLNVEWFLFMPSIYGFAFYNSYLSTVEQNSLFDRQQANYLKAKYQPLSFPLNPDKEGRKIRIVATFEHSPDLETAILYIQQKGVPEEKILAIPLEQKNEGPAAGLKSLYWFDMKGFLDYPALMAACFCALGAIYGFVLPWGPVMWGLIGFLGGLGLGILVKLTLPRNPKNRASRESKVQVVLMVDCEDEQVRSVEEILWSHHALAISKVGQHTA
ncbi:hypothetical protein [Alicyclobacillus ferrooxydans]|uniref:Uncharacterized protein n=1 Tax=Alicyclobacillus ferrooxydans TaxID=471514 RepID=A0A0P9CS12_9BACL|nr:hypothetical protein [Alicyclobacillus ferrooxydans]KPV45595.1 hypothetical protein AN477_01325 [Alicyclobacillus ferrooxydans]